MWAPLLCPLVAEWIGASLPTDGGFGAVAGEDPNVVGEVENPFPHADHQLIEVAAGQIGAADAPGEELIT